MLENHKRIAVVTGVVSAVLWLVAIVSPAVAGQRVALVLGNAAYQHTAALRTPVNDSADLGKALERLSFVVTRITDADQGALRRGLLDFATAANAADAAVVFYSGHGISAGSRNFLVPVDARLSSSRDIEFETVPLELVERAVGRAAGVRLIILDASRESSFARRMGTAYPIGSIGPGLARVDPPAGTLVAYAAKEGTVALAGEGRNSRYAAALLRHLESPGLPVEKMFRKIREEVMEATDGRQEPLVYGSLSDKRAYLGARPASSANPSANVSPAEPGKADDALTAEKLAAERLYWASVKDSEDAAEIQTYLDRYPSGTFAALARARLERLDGATGSTSPVTDPASDAPARAEAGGETPSGPSTRHPRLDPRAAEEALDLQREHRRLIQTGLSLLGFDPGPADGMFGQRSRAAIGRWQASQGEVATGYLDAEDAKTLGRKGNEAPPPGKQQSRQAAMEVLSKALRAAREIDDPSNRASLLTKIGTVLAKAGDSRRANRSFALARSAAERAEKGFSRDFALLNVAKAQALAGDTRTALATVDLMEDRETSVGELPEFARELVEAGDIAGAAQLIERVFASAERITDEGDRARLLAYAATELVKSGDAEKAALSIQRAQTAARRINDENGRNVALGYIARAQAAAGDVPAAIATSNRIEDMERRSDALNQIASAQAQVGDIQAALATAQRIEDRTYLDWALSSIATAQAETGDIRAASATVNRIRGKENNAWPLSRIVDAQVKAGDLQSALATADRIGVAGDRARVLAGIAQAQAKSGDVVGAVQTIKKASAIVEPIEEDYLREWPLQEIAKALGRTGDVRGALATVVKISAGKLRRFALFDIFRNQAEAGNVRAAIAAVELIEEQEGRSYALSGISVAQTAAGNTAAALATAGRITNAERRARTLTSIALGLIEGGRR